MRLLKIYKLIKLNNSAVSEVVTTILLLGIAVAIFSVLYMMVLSYPLETEPPYPRILATVEGDNIVLVHLGGNDLNLESKIKLDLGNESEELILNDLVFDSNNDGLWNIGEKLYYGFNYSLDLNEANITTIDIDGKRILLEGSLDIHPESDIGVRYFVNNTNPRVGELVKFTIIVSQYWGDMKATNIQINFTIPEGLAYTGHYPLTFDYDNESGIWNISELDIGESLTLEIEAEVTSNEMASAPTQLGLILDGSGSINDDDWDTMKLGLANSVRNPDLFPHDGSVEITVVQFGEVSPPHARVEIGGPVVVNETNYESIAQSIENISQMVNNYHSGATPIGCGIRLATDQMHDIGFFESEKRQVINLVTDGLPNCVWIPGTYNATPLDDQNWFQDNYPVHSGSYCMGSNRNNNGIITCRNLDVRNTLYTKIEFYFRLNYIFWSNDNLRLYYYDGDSYNLIRSFGRQSGDEEDKWLKFTDYVYDPDYKISDFKIRFESDNYWFSDEAWIDDLIIETDNGILLDDGFENDYWDEFWFTLGQESAENARNNLLQTLDMTTEQDEFDVLAVGVGTEFPPDVNWLNKTIAWPPPSNIYQPNEIEGSGWVSYIEDWTDFELAMNDMFTVIFSGISTNVQIIAQEPLDPNHENNQNDNLIITPKH